MHYPFPTMDLVVLDDALKYGSRAAKARFAVYIGDLGDDSAAQARELLAKVPTPDNAVLLAVSPDQRAIEVVYGSEVQGRGIESVRAAGGVGRRSGLPGGQPDRWADQRGAGAERRRLAALTSVPGVSARDRLISCTFATRRGRGRAKCALSRRRRADHLAANGAAS